MAIAHRNVTRLLESLDAEVPGAGVWSQAHSLAFDFSVWEIWGALLRGGRLVVVPEEAARSPEDFHELLVTERVSVLSRTPSAFYALQTVDALRRERIGSWRWRQWCSAGRRWSRRVCGGGSGSIRDCRG